MKIDTVLGIIAVLLFFIWWEIQKIGSRLKDQFPTHEERDYKWSQADPAGHAEAHRVEREARAKKN